jgi:LPS O-antigen subunit length determinant protein (WzzB/FepE family)
MPLEVLVAQLWVRRWRVALLAAVLLAGGVATILALPRNYVAEALVAPSETTGIATSALLSAAPAISGLLDPRPAGNFAVYLGALRSAEAATLLAEATPLLEGLTARRADGIGGLLRQALDLRILADLDDARAWLERNLAVTQTLGSVTWTVALSHPDRDLALDMLRRLHGFAEAKVRADLEEMARRRAIALELRLARESDLYLRQSLYEMLAQQQRVGLVVAADEAVAARIVSAPMVELRPSQPNRSLLVLLLLATAPMAATALVAAGLLLAPAPRRRPLRLEPAE